MILPNPLLKEFFNVHTGNYLFQVRVFGMNHDAAHQITVYEGSAMTYTALHGQDSTEQFLSSSTSITAHLTAGTQIAVKAFFTGTVRGAGTFNLMFSTFGATLLYVD